MRFASSAAAFLTAALVPCSAVYAADSTKIGYGQGTTLDEKGRPADAVSFNQRYSDLEAYALTNDDDRIIITFDQGYENGYTEKILDTLKEKNVKAIFFLTGDYAKKETALVQRMIDEGHILGNHGMTHASLPELSDSEAEEEIMSLHKYVLDNYGYEMQYFRCPCGEYSEKALETARSAATRRFSGVMPMLTGKPMHSLSRERPCRSLRIRLTAERYFSCIRYLQQMLRYLAKLLTISGPRDSRYSCRFITQEIF